MLANVIRGGLIELTINRVIYVTRFEDEFQVGSNEGLFALPLRQSFKMIANTLESGVSSFILKSKMR